MLSDRNFIQWIALKAFAVNKASNATESVIIFAFLCESISLKNISLKITNEFCNKGLKYCKFTIKRKKTKHVMKKDHS